MAQTLHVYKDGVFDSSGEGTQQTIERLLADGYTLGAAPPPAYIPAGLDGHELDNPAIKDAMRSIAHIPHAWGGGYDPTVDSIHGQPHFEKLTAGTEAALFAYNSDDRAIPMVAGGANSAVYVYSRALLPDEAGVQFTATYNAFAGIIVGLAQARPDLTKGLDGITKGLGLSIERTATDYVVKIIKRKDSDTLNLWSLAHSNAPVSGGVAGELKIPVTAVRDGNRHTFRIESHKGTITFGMDGVILANYVYPDDSYPLRKHITGENKGALVDHAGSYYAVQTMPARAGATPEFNLVNLFYYRLHRQQMADDFKAPLPEPPSTRVVLTQAEYDNLADKDDTRLYLIVSG